MRTSNTARLGRDWWQGSMGARLRGGGGYGRDLCRFWGFRSEASLSFHAFPLRGVKLVLKKWENRKGYFLET